MIIARDIPKGPGRYLPRKAEVQRGAALTEDCGKDFTVVGQDRCALRSLRDRRFCVRRRKFADKGGQNILEPASWGIPVQYGPHMEDFAEGRMNSSDLHSDTGA
jgi:hypothetical protein